MMSHKKRGPYKTYIFDNSAKVPKRTLNGWKSKNKTLLPSSNNCDQCNEHNAESCNFQSTNPDKSVVISESSSKISAQLTSPISEHSYNNNSVDHTQELIVERDSCSFEQSLDDSNDDYCKYESTDNEQSDEADESDEEVNAEKCIETDNVNRNANESVHNSSPNKLQIPREVLIRTLMVLAIKLHHNLDNVVAKHMTSLIDAMCQTSRGYDSLHYFKRIINAYSFPIQIHHCCPVCGMYVGIEIQSDQSNDVQNACDNEEESQSHHIDNNILQCDNCNEVINVKNNRMAGNFFLYLSLTDQLRVFCTQHHDDLYYPRNRIKQCSYAIEDIFDGKLYKAKYSEETLENMMSINFSVDGTPVFKSSHTSVTPILCTVNELHPQQRTQHIMLVSVFIGSSKPKMNEYLKPFVEETKSLYTNGFEYEFKGKKYHKRCRILLGVCDSVERPNLRCSTLFRGAYGCGLCKHEGQEIAKGRGHVRVYPIDEEGNAFGEGLRNHNETLLHAEKKEKGIKCLSILCDIPDYDIIDNLQVDWMHCVALGVCRQFLKLWFDSTFHDRDFYLGLHIDEIDELLVSFKPSMDISRTPRKISDRLHFKAHELVIWLLFYSLPILKAFLPGKYVDHWSLLVEAISILCKTSIFETEVYYARQCIFKFVYDVPNLYGIEHVSFNVHLLTHLPDSVLKWGPLWSYSAFCYENFHQQIKKYIKSSNAADLQIFEFFRSKCAMDELFKLYGNDLSPQQRKLLNELIKNKERPKPSTIVGNVGLLGKVSIERNLPTTQFLALQRINVNIDEGSPVQYYHRIVINKEIIHSKVYTKVRKRNSYTVLLSNNTVFEIEIFMLVKVQNNEVCYALGQYFERTTNTYYRNVQLNHLIFTKPCLTLTAVKAEMIQQKVTIFPMPHDVVFVACIQPNKFEMLT